MSTLSVRIAFIPPRVLFPQNSIPLTNIKSWNRSPLLQINIIICYIVWHGVFTRMRGKELQFIAARNTIKKNRNTHSSNYISQSSEPTSASLPNLIFSFFSHIIFSYGLLYFFSLCCISPFIFFPSLRHTCFLSFAVQFQELFLL